MIAETLTPAQEAFVDLFDALKQRGIVGQNLIDPVNSAMMRLSRALFGSISPRQRPSVDPRNPEVIERSRFISPQAEGAPRGFRAAEIGMSVHDPNEAA